MSTIARSRSTSVPRARAAGRRIAALGLVTLVALALGYLAISLRVAEGVTHVQRRAIDPAAAAVTLAAREEVSFRSTDGLLLRGWFYRAAGDRAIVFVHGKDSNRLWGYRFERLADVFLAEGFSVLTFDLRGHGESQGDRFSLGQYERKDVAGAVDFVTSRGFAEPRIVLYGESMGAGTVLQAVAERPGVGPIIADSSYSDGRTVIGESATEFTGLPGWFTPGILLAARLFGLDVDAVKPAEVVRAHPEHAYLFIACDRDEIVPVHHSRDLAAASASPATRLWIAPACFHVQAFETYPSEYGSRVVAFLAANLP